MSQPLWRRRVHRRLHQGRAGGPLAELPTRNVELTARAEQLAARVQKQLFEVCDPLARKKARGAAGAASKG